MPQVDTTSPLLSYILTEEEVEQGTILQPLQRAALQNMKLNLMQQRLALIPTSMTPADKEAYWCQNAYLQGQFDILEQLIETSDIFLANLSNQPEGN